MALETGVYPQDPTTYHCKEYHTWSYGFDLQEENNKALIGTFETNMEHGFSTNWDSSSTLMVQKVKEWDHYSSPEPFTGEPNSSQPAAAAEGRRKRRRTKSCKNKEELESQRMTHIAVERNRRKQMNDYLAVLRSLMPASYVQRGDQASIIGGAINFVKELEKLLQTLEVHKRTNTSQQPPTNNGFSPLFSNCFSFPQYSTRGNDSPENEPVVAENNSAMADIEVTMVECHATLKILSKRRPRQLLKMVAGLQCLKLTILHLNVTTVDQMVLYTLSVKVEDGCLLTTVDDIANAVNQLLRRIQDEASLN